MGFLLLTACRRLAAQFAETVNDLILRLREGGRRIPASSTPG